MPHSRPLLFAVRATLALSGCGDSSSALDCPRDVVVTVGPGTAPSFGWAPDCRAGYMAVTESGVLIWAIGWLASDPDRANAIESPITTPPHRPACP